MMGFQMIETNKKTGVKQTKRTYILHLNEALLSSIKVIAYRSRTLQAINTHILYKLYKLNIKSYTYI